MKVIVVDDVGVVRHSMDRLLTDRGYNVVTSASGTDAIEVLQKDNTIGAVLTDLLMPGMNGVELFQASLSINRLTDAGEIPPPEFILMTALRPSADVHHKEAGLLRQAASLGFVDVMLKPIDKDRLFRNLTAIEERLSGQRTEITENPDTNAGTSNAVRTPLASRASGPGNDWWTALEELRTTTQNEIRQFHAENSKLKEKLGELQALVEELRHSS